MAAFFRINEARNWNDFLSALRGIVVPAQNIVYADVDGHIGYYAPARIPVRAHGDGSAPAEGWSGDAEWVSWIPFDRLPHAFDPPEHFIATANHVADVLRKTFPKLRIVAVTGELTVTLWCPLFDVGADDGVREYAFPNAVPGQLLEHVDPPAPGACSELPNPERFTFRPVPLRCGDIVAHHAYAVHRSGPNRSGRHGGAVALSYRSSAHRMWPPR